MNALIEKVRNEPVLVTALVGSVLALAIGFGVPITTEQIALVIAVVNAGLAFVARKAVTPNVKLTVDGAE